MKRFRRCTRISILSLLVLSVFVPIFLLSGRLIHPASNASKDHIEDLSTIKYRTDAQKLRAVQEVAKGVNGPPSVVYIDGNHSSYVSMNSSNDEETKTEEARNSGDLVKLSEMDGTNHDDIEGNQQSEHDKSFSKLRGKEHYKEKMARQDQDVNVKSLSRSATDEKLKELKDQAIMAKVYLNFAPPNSNSHLVKELRLRIKILERAMGESTKDSDLSKRALQRSRLMEATLLKASKIYPDCPAMVKKLRAMTYNTEEQVRAQRRQVKFLVQLAGRTTPKGLHCLSMRLTTEYFGLPPEDRKLPSHGELHDPDLYHIAVFSDNVLACSVVVQSTISAAREPERIVFHIVTDALNLPAISMWLLLYPPGKATIEIQSIDSFDWLSNKLDAMMQNKNAPVLRYTSALNHLRFYLPDVFPRLNKILLLDHDVVVQRDLTALWSINMKGKVNGAVETCQADDLSFRRMDMFVNFSDPMVARRFDVKGCTWAFGMNIFDLQKWRKRNLTRDYEKYLQLGKRRPLWKAGSLPLGWVTFYNQTVSLDKRWHVLGLGFHPGVRQSNIDQAAVIHYDGAMKPWLDIGLEKYKHYWREHVNYSNPFLQQCNIHQ